MSNRYPIATIKLAPGEAGYYDEYSRIYLSSTNPVTTIYSGTNCTQIKKSIKSGRLRLVSGSFEEIPKELKLEMAAVVPKKPAIEAKKEAEVVEPKVEKEVSEPIVERQEKVQETIATEESLVVEEEKVEQKEVGEVEIVTEAPAPKRRKKTTKKVTPEA